MKRDDKNESKFLNLKVPVFYNKNNGQISISLPKRKLKSKTKGAVEKIPSSMSIRILKWWKK